MILVIFKSIDYSQYGNSGKNHYLNRDTKTPTCPFPKYSSIQFNLTIFIVSSSM